jgi:hypothetical protein
VFDNVVFQRIDKLLVGLHAAHIDEGTISSNKNLCSGLTTTNSRGVRAGGARSDCFIAAVHTQRWVG